MTEQVAATPGWVDERLDALFASLPAWDGVAAARDGYAVCLSGRKAPATPSDTLGSEFDGCRRRLLSALAAAGVEAPARAALDAKLEALEAEIAAES